MKTEAPEILFLMQESQMAGVEYSTLYLAEYFQQERSFQAKLLIPASGPLEEQCLKKGIDCRRYKRLPFFSIQMRLGSRQVYNPFAVIWNAASVCVNALSLARVLKKEKPRLVCTKGLWCHFYGAWAAASAGIPCVWHLQDMVSEACSGIFKKILCAAAEKWSVSIIADGEPIALQLKSLKQTRVEVIPNGVDCKHFSPAEKSAELCREFGIKPNEKIIGNVSRLTAWKGQHILLEAFSGIAADFPDWKLLLVGSSLFGYPEYEAELKRFVRERKIQDRVIFTGQREDIAELLNLMDLFVFPSVQRDTCPLSLLSALACGRAVIVSDVPGIREMIRGGISGELVPPGDPKALAQKLRLLIKDQTLLGKLRAAARCEALENYSLKSYGSACASFFCDRLTGYKKNAALEL